MGVAVKVKTAVGPSSSWLPPGSSAPAKAAIASSKPISTRPPSPPLSAGREQAGNRRCWLLLGFCYYRLIIGK